MFKKRTVLNKLNWKMTLNASTSVRKKSFYRKCNMFLKWQFLGENYFFSLEKELGYNLNSWDIKRKFSINKIENEYEYYFFYWECKNEGGEIQQKNLAFGSCKYFILFFAAYLLTSMFCNFFHQWFNREKSWCCRAIT